MKKKRKWLKRLLITVFVVALLFLVMLVVNIICNVSLRKYINSFEAIEYPDDRLIPVMEDGHYTFVSDRDVDVMFITDIHIGGGFWSFKNDKKSIYEVITMLQGERPDFVILGGDNTYCVPGLGFNGGNTFNNRQAARTVIEIFEHEKVYFTTVFGNHDTEAFDYANRQQVGELYMDDSFEYCFFNEEFTDTDAETVPSVSNQFVVMKNSAGDITKLLLLLDTNAYVDTSFMSTVMGRYDVIHEKQVEWVGDTIKDLSESAGLPQGEYLKTIAFMHIPFGEYRDALDDLICEETDNDGNVTYTVKENPENTQFCGGFWGEEKVCYGGLNNEGTPAEQDNFFETIAEEMGSLEASFCGHDHANNAIVNYKGVKLAYGYSIDNEAYGSDIKYSGQQRGATIITLSPDGHFYETYKNAYTDYGCSVSEFVDVYMDKPLYPQWFRTVK